MLLLGTPIATDYKKKLTDRFGSEEFAGCHIAIITVTDDIASQTYVAMKQRRGQRVGLDVQIRGDHPSAVHSLNSVSDILTCIDDRNRDDACVGIIIQLPLPAWARDDYARIVGAVTPSKDIDGLGGVMRGQSQIGLHDFLPATPQAVMDIIDRYEIDVSDGRPVLVIGQSLLVGRPVADACAARGATTMTANQWTDRELLRRMCQQADIIISATGQTRLVTPDICRDDRSQYIIDVGRGKRDGKPVGDVHPDVADHIAGLTPVPGGVGPVTIAALFANINKLWKMSGLHNH